MFKTQGKTASTLVHKKEPFTVTDESGLAFDQEYLIRPQAGEEVRLYFQRAPKYTGEAPEYMHLTMSIEEARQMRERLELAIVQATKAVTYR